MTILPFHYRSRKFCFSSQPAVMGILNTTPDSFSDGGLHYSPESALAHARKMLSEGADFIDVGGESTRPGFTPVSADEEISRVIPVIRGIREFSGIPISIDTSKAPVAEAALASGADIVNDVTALADPDMTGVIRKYSAGCILMHSLPLAPGDDAVSLVRQSLGERLEKGLSETGLGKEFFMLDPGIGFGKDYPQNLALLKNCPEFRIGGCGVLVGMSRKSFLGKMLGVSDPRERLAGTLSTALFCAKRGCEILRMHDVRETVQALTCQTILQEE